MLDLIECNHDARCTRDTDGNRFDAKGGKLWGRSVRGGISASYNHCITNVWKAVATERPSRGPLARMNAIFRWECIGMGVVKAVRVRNRRVSDA